MHIRFLGTGTSFGVPVIGCDCAVCHSTDPRDRRYRSSVFIACQGAAVVIDTGPEFRLQALAAGIRSLDAVLLTHAHADHIAGLDDVRPLTRECSLPVYANGEALRETRRRFGYVFEKTQEGGGKPDIALVEAPREGVVVGAARFIPVPVLHGELPILGWRIKDFAYITDCSRLPAESVEMLRGVRTVVINGLRYEPHDTHFCFDQAFEAARAIGAQETWLTHINHGSSHAEIQAYCAQRGRDVGAHPAWDGLTLTA